jgi:type IV secretory pathway VirB6-like protein
MRRLSRWITGVLGFLVLPVLGMIAGAVIAFVYTYVFLDTDRTGNADIGTNMAFFGIAVILGMIGLIVGLIGARKLSVWAFGSESAGRRAAHVVFGEVDR